MALASTGKEIADGAVTVREQRLLRFETGAKFWNIP
jgi:hypothetical protein